MLCRGCGNQYRVDSISKGLIHGLDHLCLKLPRAFILPAISPQQQARTAGIQPGEVVKMTSANRAAARDKDSHGHPASAGSGITKHSIHHPPQGCDL
jgi:hypothetical protein